MSDPIKITIETGSAAALWNRATADGLLSTPGGAVVRRDVAFRALRILKAHITGETVPTKLYTSTDSAQWFLSARRLGTVVKSSPHQQALEAVPAGGATLAQLATKMGKSTSEARHLLASLEASGVVSRPRKGFYVRVLAAAA